MISFKELKVLITKCCKVESKSDLSERFSFEVDFTNMEKRLQEVDQNFHVLAFNEKVKSYVPYLSDVQMLTEYVHKPDEIKMVFNGNSEICPFMIFSVVGESGKEYKLHDKNGKIVAAEDIFKLCNGSSDEIDWSMVKEIVEKLPIYQVLAIRTFVKKQDKFDYKLCFRSNYEMISFFKSLQNNTAEDTSTEE